jgi:putative flavoprotein involved in K+ transport
METLVDTIVIGAGQAGLATGYHLQRAGRSFLILEANAAPGGSWPHYYDSLRLFSPARYSSLPGLPLPGAPDRYPARDEVVAYLRDYATHFALPIVTGALVAEISRRDSIFQITTADGRTFHARSLVVATGAFRDQYVPQLPGQDRFRGQILHSADYRNPKPFQGERVVVVGAANSAVQIAVDLVRAARVTLATREPVRFVAQRLFGKDVHFWLRLTGLDYLPTLSDTSTPVLDTGVYRTAITAGQPAQRPMFTAFVEDGVRWADGLEERVDVVIFATGYRPRFLYLANLGALDVDGHAIQRGGISLTVPGLYFVGQSKQRNFASATLRGVGPDAAVVVRHLARFLQARPAARRWSVAGLTQSRLCRRFCRPAPNV